MTKFEVLSVRKMAVLKGIKLIPFPGLCKKPSGLKHDSRNLSLSFSREYLYETYS